jgi:glycolate oxidase|uniref:FAD-binding protein n=1 Tax=Desulfobacca acetoxidans TaxID=60893 RepID=A0A7C3WRY0_9BACT
MLSETVSGEIIRIVGSENALTSPEERFCYAYDATDLTAMPDLVVFPGSAEEISQILELANRHRFPVVPRGAGTGRAGGSVPIRGGVVLVLTRMNRILEINAADLVAVVEPGVITGHLKKAAEEHGLYYPPDPGSADYCTIGGNVATGAGGAVAVQYGVTRDYVLGLTVVLPTGEIVDCGSRTMKGVVGYDLTRLFLGSEGTLGVIVRIVLRLVPRPESRQTLAAGFADLEAAARAVGQILQSGLTPTALEFMDRATLDCIRPVLPFPVPEGIQGLLMIAVDGQPKEVATRAAKMARLCREAGARLVLRAKDATEADRLWQARRAISPATFKVKPHKIAEDVAVPLSALPRLVAEVQEIARRRALPIICFGHAGDGNLHVNIMYDRTVEQERLAARRAVEELFTSVRRLCGTLSGEHGVGLAKAPYLGLELSPAMIALQRRLKRAFDPNNIMNPGKIFPPSPDQI